MKASFRLVGLGLLLLALTTAAATRMRTARLGKQPDGSYLVSTGQRISGGAIAFAGWPLDLALHPSGEFFAVLNQTEVFLCKANGILADSRLSLGPKVHTSFLRSIEGMLGLDPLNRFDALAYPMQACFHDRLDLAAYTVRPNKVALDERNPSKKDKMTEADRWWLDKSLSLDWSRLDAPDPYWLNRIVWYSLYKDTRPYPARPGEQPGMARADDDD
jgi:hypothetical protein